MGFLGRVKYSLSFVELVPTNQSKNETIIRPTNSFRYVTCTWQRFVFRFTHYTNNKTATGTEYVTNQQIEFSQLI